MRKSRVVDQRGSHESASGIRASYLPHLHLPPHDALPSFVCNVAASRARSILVHGVPSNPRGAVALARSFAVPERAELAKIFPGTSGCVRSRSDGFPRHGRGGGGRPRPRRRARRAATRSSAVKVNARARRRRGSPRQPPRLGRRQARECGAARSRPLRVRPAPSVRPSGCTPRTARSTPPRCAPPNDSHEEPSRTSKSARRARPARRAPARRASARRARQTPRELRLDALRDPGVFSPRRKNSPPPPPRPSTR